MVIRLFLAVLISYTLVAIGMYVFQRAFEYAPDQRPLTQPKDNNVPEMQVVHAVTEDRLVLQAWFVPPRHKDGKVVVLFHGNAGSIIGRAVKARHLMDHGYGVYLCEYRGYGGNPGSPSEQGFYQDARAAISWLNNRGYNFSHLIFYGESIGSGVAVQMAVETPPRLLVLEAPFTSAVDIAKIRYSWLPVDLLMKDRFDNEKKISSISSPLLIVHGDEDQTVPVQMAKILFQKAPHPKEIAIVTGADHVDLYEHHAGYIITDWIKDKNP